MVSLHIGHIFMGAQYVLVQKDYGWYPEGARVVVNEETKNEGELVRWIHVEEAGDVLAWIKVRNNCCIGEEGLVIAFARLMNAEKVCGVCFVFLV